MLLFESFIKNVMTFSTKLNDDGLRCFRSWYQFSRNIVILCLTFTVCQGVEVKSVHGCKVNYMFIKTMNKCIGEYIFINSILYVLKHVQDLKISYCIAWIIDNNNKILTMVTFCSSKNILI